jgi:dTDP-4-amino-4,6-dideoxygalactose transaminase
VQSLVFKVPEGVDRDALIVKLKDNGVETTLGTYCLSGTSYYRGKYCDVQPNAMRLQETTITLPCFEGVDVAQVCGVIRSVMA